MLVPLLERRKGLTGSADFLSYQRYLTHRLKKLRRRENLVSPPGKKYNPPPLEAKASHAEIALLQAERCWAASHVAQCVLDSKTSLVSVAKLPRVVSSKLAKAEKLAREFVTLTDKDLASQAYAAFISAERAVVQEKWPLAGSACAKAYLGFWAISLDLDSSLLNAYQEYEPVGLIPLYRLTCAKLKVPPMQDRLQTSRVLQQDSAFRRLVDQRRTYVTHALSTEELTVQFRDHVARVHNERLAAAIGQIREATKEHSELKDVTVFLPENRRQYEGSIRDPLIAKWDSLLTTITNIKRDMEEHDVPRDQNIDIMQTYATFQLRCRQIQRDGSRALWAESDQKENAYRLTMLVLEFCNQLAELPGVSSDEELVEGISGMRKFFMALRAHILGRLYPKPSKERLALFSYAARVIKEAKVSSALNLPINDEVIKEFSWEPACDEAQTYSYMYIEQEVLNRSQVMGSFASNINFNQLLPKDQTLEIADWGVRRLDAVAVKPVFYDIAYNYLLPTDADAMEVEEEKEKEKEAPAKRGLFGLFNIS